MPLPDKIIELDDVGTVRISRSTRAKRLIVRVTPDRGVLVTVPFFYPLDDAIRFLKTRHDWLVTSIAKVKGLQQKQLDKYQNNSKISKFHTLMLCTNDKNNVRMYITDDKLTISYPASMTKDNLQVKQAIQTGIKVVLKREAELYLPARIATLSRLHGLPFGKVSLHNPRTLWGSCTWNNDINLSIQLMKLPDHLIDYVILHELAHTIHKNHSAAFYALLNKLCNGNELRYRSEMKGYTTEV